MKPKVKPSVTLPSQLTSSSSSSMVKMVRFAATPSLVEDDLTSLLQICHTSMAHEKGGGTSARSAGHWWSKPSEEPFKIQELNEDIYGDFMLRGLKIANQR